MALTLKAWRAMRNNTQEDCAKALNITLPTYRRWENRPNMIPTGKALELANFLDVDIHDIIFLPSDDTLGIKRYELNVNKTLH